MHAPHDPARSVRALARRPGVGVALQVAASALWIAQAACLAWAVQAIAGGRGFDAMAWPATGVLLVGVLRAALDAAGAQRVFAQARAALSELRAAVVAALAARSPLDRSRPASGLAASALAEQAETVVPYLVRYQSARWRVRVVPLLILLCVAPLSWVAALVLVVAAPMIPLFMAIVGWRAKAASEAQMLEAGGMNAFLLDRLRGLSTLRALDAVDATALRLRASAQSLRERTMAVLRIAFLSSAVLELFAALGVAMVAVYVGFHLLGQLGFGAWGRSLGLGQGLFILLLAPAFFEPLRELSAVWHDRAAGEAALDALAELTRGDARTVGGEAAPAGPAAPPPGRPPSVCLRGIRLAHGDEAAFLHGFELAVAPGERVALFGASGAGKTALLSLIAGLVAADAGRVEIDGVELSAQTAPALRRRIAWMGQKPHVFAGSVQSNVALGAAGATRESIQRAVRFAGLGEVTQAALGTALGEGGSGLSGGEAVRLALARMALRGEADLLLVDEPTAHLDRDTARQVSEALDALARGRTLIVATHDPVLAARMDRVIDVGAVPAECAA